MTHRGRPRSKPRAEYRLKAKRANPSALAGSGSSAFLCDRRQQPQPWVTTGLAHAAARSCSVAPSGPARSAPGKPGPVFVNTAATCAPATWGPGRRTSRGAAKSKAKRGEPGGKPPRLLSLGRAVGSINVAGKNPPVLHGQLPARECCPSYITHWILFPNALHHGLYHECLNPLELLGVGSRINALSTRAGGSSYSHLWPKNPQQIPKTPKFTTSD